MRAPSLGARDTLGFLTSWKSSETVRKASDLPHPGPLPLGEGESISALDKTGGFGLCSDWLKGSLSQREGWGEGEGQANSMCVTNRDYWSGF